MDDGRGLFCTLLVPLFCAVCVWGSDLPILSRNLVPNGSFESGLSGWQRVWGRGRLSDAGAHGGSHALTMENAGGMSTPLTPFEPCALEYSLWIRTADVQVGPNPYNVAVVQVTGFGSDRKALRHWDLCQVSGTTDWQEFRGTLDLSGQRDVAFIKVSCLVWNTTGTAWFDDILIGPRYSGPAPGGIAVRSVDRARPYSGAAEPLPIIPSPQHAVDLGGRFALTSETGVYFAASVASVVGDAVALWNEIVAETCGSAPETAYAVLPGGLPPRSVVFCSPEDAVRLAGGQDVGSGAADAETAAALAETVAVPVPDPEGYRLLVTPRAILLGARTGAGFLHAVQTLRCLLTPVRPGVASVASVAVADWPDLTWRGMYLSMWYGPGAGAGCDLGLLKRIIRNVLAGSKLNALLLQVDNTMQYRSHPELGGLYSAEEMRDLVRFCTRYGVEVIPLIQSFGHNHYFVFGGGKRHAELAENERMYSVCPKHPGSVALFTDLYDEIIEVFDPRYVHIGCDEVGPLGVCARCKDTPKWRLFADYVNALRDHLAGKGVRTMIWGDYLLDPEQFPGSSYCHGAETWRALELLKKDIVICDWHYNTGVGPRHDYPTTKALHDLGFPVVGVPATYSRLNNATYAQYLRRNGLDSMFSSVWASVHNWKGIKDRPDWMGGMLDAAEYAWTTDAPPPGRPPPYSSEAVVLGRTRVTTPAGTSGFLLDLGGSRNASLPGDVPGFPFGRHTLAGIRFRTLDPMDDDAGRWCAGAGGGSGLPASVVDIPVGGSVTALAFLHAYCPPRDKAVENWQTVGWYDVVFADNATVRVPIVTGLNIAPYEQSTPRRLVDSARVLVSAQRAVYALEWRNPYPEKAVHHINLTSSADHDGAVYLLAATGLTRLPEASAAAVPGTARTWLEGFGAPVDATHQRGYSTYRGESAQSWLEYATDGSEFVTWTTEPVPEGMEHDRVTFVTACGLGSGAGDAAHTVAVNGRDVVVIGTPHRTDAHWQGERGEAFFDYVTHDRWDSFGVLYLTVDAELLSPGRPATVTVRGSAAGTKSWFMVHGYSDTITHNLLSYGRGLIPPDGNHTLP